MNLLGHQEACYHSINLKIVMVGIAIPNPRHLFKLLGKYSNTDLLYRYRIGKRSQIVSSRNRDSDIIITTRATIVATKILTILAHRQALTYLALQRRRRHLQISTEGTCQILSPRGNLVIRTKVNKIKVKVKVSNDLLIRMPMATRTVLILSTRYLTAPIMAMPEIELIQVSTIMPTNPRPLLTKQAMMTLPWLTTTPPKVPI